MWQKQATFFPDLEATDPYIQHLIRRLRRGYLLVKGPKRYHFGAKRLQKAPEACHQIATNRPPVDK